MSGARKIFVTVGLVLATCLLLSQYRNAVLSQYTITEMNDENLGSQNKDKKMILYWMPMFDVKDFGLGLGSEIFQNCIYKNCYTTYNKNLLPVDKFDAIIFHGVEYNKKDFGEPEKRSPHQIYIFSNQESPVHTREFFRNYNNFYNWTMTYRLDSDILRPYGYLENISTQYKPPTIEEIRKRPKKIAWMVSNCATSSEREHLFSEIRKYIPVDVYGRCGDLKCPRNTAGECYAKIEKEYKFYFSFENSLCEDYVTEKLYNTLKLNIVPIVYGGADYNTFAPPKSVINVMDFKSVKDLVDYIQFLDTHPENYLEYFKWKKHYIVNTSNKLTLCSLCKKLNEPIQPKTYNNLVRWWNGGNLDKCSTNFINQFL